MTRRLRTVAVVAAALALIGSASATSRQAGTLEQLVGRRLVVAVEGRVPSASLLARIRAGEVGGVILFGPNATSAPQVRDLTRALHGAAEAAGRPPLLVVADQEGGTVRRFRWAPPAISAAALAGRSLAFVEALGRQTGHALSALGVDANLAPVADVPAAGPSFVRDQQRAYAETPERAASRAAAFARGLGTAGVLATAKHFPGLGRAAQSTDLQAVAVPATRAQFEGDLLPFRRLVAANVPLVMLANASYPALDDRPAVWSRAVHALLRNGLGFGGVTISDALEPLARTQGTSVAAAALRAARAGTDLLLLTGREADTARVYDELVAAARDGRLTRAALEASYARIVALDVR